MVDIKRRKEEIEVGQDLDLKIEEIVEGKVVVDHETDVEVKEARVHHQQEKDDEGEVQVQHEREDVEVVLFQEIEKDLQEEYQNHQIEVKK